MALKIQRLATMYWLCAGCSTAPSVRPREAPGAYKPPRRHGRARMRILIEPGGYKSRNMGDLAMFLTAVARLEHRWPEAELVTFTGDPDRLRRYAPRVVPCSLQAREELIAAHHPDWGLPHRLPLATRVLLGLDRFAASVAPRNWKQISKGSRRFVQTGSSAGSFTVDLDRPDKEGWRRILRSFSLVVISGAGGLCDPFLRHAWSVLELLEIAVSAGVPTALFSQGIGPMQASILRSKACAVLPYVDLVAVRERRESPRLLRELGVPAGRIHIGGDDAIESAYGVRTAIAGNCLGVNLRLADYANVHRALASSILRTVSEFGQARTLQVLPIPISFHDHEADLDAVASVLGRSTSPPCPAEPTAVARLVGRCRLVVTGSYHAAVFALAQGIPVVAFSNSLYYDHKFLGLAEMFGAGCEVVRLSDAAAPQKLRAALDRLSDAGAGLREPLLRSACEQIDGSQAAYRRVFEIVSGRPQPAGAHPVSPQAILSAV